MLSSYYTNSLSPFFAEELRLQRNPDNYALLRPWITDGVGSAGSGGDVTPAAVNSSSSSLHLSGATASSTTSTTAGGTGTRAATAGCVTSSSSSSLHASSGEAIDDKLDFLMTRKAMEDLGLGADEVLDVFRVVAAVLKLGNLEFVPTTNMDGTDGCAVSNDYGNLGGSVCVHLATRGESE